MPGCALAPAGLDGHCWDHIALDGALAYDLPGHRVRSGLVPLTVAAMAEGVIAKVAGPLDLVGLSMGGMVGLQITVRFRPVRSLVVACAATHHYI